jgi:hypothetical protein
MSKVCNPYVTYLCFLYNHFHLVFTLRASIFSKQYLFLLIRVSFSSKGLINVSKEVSQSRLESLYIQELIRKYISKEHFLFQLFRNHPRKPY